MANPNVTQKVFIKAGAHIYTTFHETVEQADGTLTRKITVYVQPHTGNTFVPCSPFDDVPNPPRFPREGIKAEALARIREANAAFYEEDFHKGDAAAKPLCAEDQAAARLANDHYYKKWSTLATKPTGWHGGERTKTAHALGVVEALAGLDPHFKQLLRRGPLREASVAVDGFAKSAACSQAVELGHVTVSPGFHSRVKALVDAYQPHHELRSYYKQFIVAAVKAAVHDVFAEAQSIRKLTPKEVRAAVRRVKAWLRDHGAPVEMLAEVLGHEDLDAHISKLFDGAVKHVVNTEKAGLRATIRAMFMLSDRQARVAGSSVRAGPGVLAVSMTEAVLASNTRFGASFVRATVEQFLAARKVEMLRGAMGRPPTPVAQRATTGDVAAHAARARQVVGDPVVRMPEKTTINIPEASPAAEARA